MLSRHETGRKRVGEGGESSSSLKFLQEVETISRALYPDKNPRDSLNASNNVPSKSSSRTHSGEPQKEKKSIWNWPLRALSHVRNRRFNCCFSVQIHSIEGLPPVFQDIYLTVHWKRRDESLSTRPAKVLNGTAEFDEKLTYTCSVYGSRSGPHHSAKYEAKHFLLYAAVVGSPEVDLGKHRMDLTRLLPLTLEELQDEKSSGKWSTTFQLTGKARGATLNVSFGYTVVGDTRNPAPSANIQNVRGVSNAKQYSNNNTMMARTSSIKSGQGNGKATFRRYESLPSVVDKDHHALPHNAEDIKDLHEVLPVPQSDLASSVSILYQKFDEEKVDSAIESQSEHDVVTKQVEAVESISCREDDVNAQVVEASVIGHETEVPFVGFEKDGNIPEAGIEEVVEVGTGKSPPEDGIKLYQKEEESVVPPDDEEVQGHKTENDESYSKERIMKELESALKNVEMLETAALDPEEDQENDADAETSSTTPIKEVASPNLSDVTDSVASEFLNMLGIEHSPFGLSFNSEPESPRERLLREFEKETLATGSSLFDFNIEDDEPQTEYDNEFPEEPASDFEEDFDLASIIHDIEEEFQWETQERIARPRAKVLADLESEALMREWGMNEKTFQNSPPHNGRTAFHPANLPPEEPLQLPPLGEGLGPVVQTKNGGFLRSMNPSLFQNSKAGGSLIMQVSTPVVVPAEMGSGIMDILQRLATAGIEKLSMQANKLMPLDDITGKTMQEVVWETSPAIDGAHRDPILENESYETPGYESRPEGRASSGAKPKKFSSSSGNSDIDSEYVSLEDLAPLAMDQIEALALEGLRIQSGMSDEDAPSNITAQSIGEISAFQGKSGSLGLEGAAGLQLLNVKDTGDDVDGLMGLSLTLDEWMKLDSGDIGDEDEISERTSKILAAHHANSLEFVRRGSKGERRKGKSGRKCGLLGNNFTVALMVQLRDPLRNYEPVGAPMLSLIQVERVFVPPKPKIYSTVSELRKDTDEEEEQEGEPKATQEEKASEEQGVPQYKIAEVHLAGVKTEPGKKPWGNAAQQQSGSRWLIANGMGKGNKHPLMKSKPSSTRPSGGDALWSVSSRGSGAKWKEPAKLKPHVRNPNFIMPK